MQIKDELQHKCKQNIEGEGMLPIIWTLHKESSADILPTIVNNHENQSINNSRENRQNSITCVKSN